MNNIGAIRDRMKSIRQTVQLSSAQKLIAGARIVKARKAIEQSRPYHERIQRTIASILRDCEVKNPYLDAKSPKKKRGLLVISADRGLAGGYNQNIMKLVSQTMAEQPVTRLMVVGNVGYGKLSAQGLPVDKEFVYPVEAPSVYTAREMAERLLALFEQGELDCVDVVYTVYKSAVRMTPVIERLFPLEPEHFGAPSYHYSSYEPSPEEVLDILVPKYLKGYLYGCLVQAWVCELNSRITAMDSAIKNGNEILTKLRLEYNRARQGAITQEITEIVAGAAAME